MKKKTRKIIKASLTTLFGFGLLAFIISTSLINVGTNTSNLFAEIVLSDNTSVIADKSFSETTFNGYRDFLNSRNEKELDRPVEDFREGFGLWRRPGTTNSEKETTFKGIFENGKDIIIAPGFNSRDAINNIAQDPAYFNKGFLLLDAGLDSKARNASTVIFRMEQAGFQCGVAASEFLNVNESIFGKDGALKIGGFVGMPIPSTLDFLIGFQKGMVAWNKHNPLEKQIEWTTLGNNIDSYKSGSFGIGDGRQISKNLLNAGADVIMPIAGPQTLDTIAEIRLQNRPVIVVAADSAQEDNSGIQYPIPGLGSSIIKNADGKDSTNNNIIQFSAVKKLDIAVQGTLTAISNLDGSNIATFDGSQYGGFGYTNIIALGEKGESALGISQAGRAYFAQGLGGTDPGIVVSGLPENIIFKEMIGAPTDTNAIQLFNTPSGTPGNGGSGAVDKASIERYSNGLNNQKISIAPEIDGKEVRLNGSHFAPPLPTMPFLLSDYGILRRKGI